MMLRFITEKGKTVHEEELCAHMVIVFFWTSIVVIQGICWINFDLEVWTIYVKIYCIWIYSRKDLLITPRQKCRSLIFKVEENKVCFTGRFTTYMLFLCETENIIRQSLDNFS